ncbi:MAG TPA: hypothetical protein VFA26_15805 [Gemmataceae bacterium]|nr:hypothetical protein [Gemmataceae bacterium]
MNPCDVGLTREAEDNLAEIWVEATDRQAVTEAEAAIYDLLRSDPAGKGTPVAEGLYKISHAPLTAFCSIDEARRAVEINRVWRPG